MEAYFDSHSASRDKIIATLRRVGETALCRRRALLLNNFLTKGSDAVPYSALSGLIIFGIIRDCKQKLSVKLKGAEAAPHLLRAKKTDKGNNKKTWMSLPRKKRRIVQPSSLLCRDKAARLSICLSGAPRLFPAKKNSRRAHGKKKADASTVLEETDRNVESKLLGYLD